MAAFTLFHVLLSLIGIVSGFVVAFGLLQSKRLDALTALFLAATSATTLTGFLFPFKGFTPGIAVGILSTFVLALALFARYASALAGPWRWIYVLAAMLAQYFNFFVLIAQSFQKIPALKALAPTQNEPPFAVTQLAALLFFILLTLLAARRFHPAPPATTTPFNPPPPSPATATPRAAQTVIATSAAPPSRTP